MGPKTWSGAVSPDPARVARPVPEDPALSHLRRMVDEALGDVRREEDVGPALRLAALVGSLPLLLLSLVVVLRLLSVL